MQKNENEDEYWYLGDVVRLKSGGPLMTITGFTCNEKENFLSCKWFDGGSVQEADFEPYEIIKN